MKVGSLVAWKGTIPASAFGKRYGLVIEWYDSSHGYVNVLWHTSGKNIINPCHVSKLEVVHEY